MFSEGAELGSCVVVHGGAGDIPDARRPAHEAGCLEASRAGWAVLERDGSALDAVQAAARVLEDLPRYNAGTGACLNERGEVEHDAALMFGEDRSAGAVCALHGFKNPIDVARAVLDEGRHVLIAGDGAAEFARAAGIASVDPASLTTELARAALERWKKGQTQTGWAGGTIGSVARDARGQVAAATSTGGTIGKRVGRVGDAPIIGAGTYADSRTGAISATGDGEATLRYGLALRIAESLRAAMPPEAAARLHVAALADELSGKGGVIVVDAAGRVGIARSTRTMSFAWTGEHGEKTGS